MRFLRLKTLILLIFATLAVIGGVAGLATVSGVQSAKASVERMREMAGVLRRQTLSDMYHDGLRAIVYVAIYEGARGGASGQAVLKELDKTIADLKAGVEGIPERGLGSVVAAAKPELVRLTEVYAGKARDTALLAFSNPKEAEARLPSFSAAFDDLAVAMDKMGDFIEEAAGEAEKEAGALQDRLQWTTGVAGALIGLALAGLFFWLRGTVVAGLVGLGESLSARDGDDVLARIEARHRSNELGELAKAIRRFRAEGVEAERIRVALDSCPINVLAADNEGVIVYANPAVLGLMREHVAEFRAISAGFDPDRVVGATIDIFHGNAGRVRSIVGDLQGAHRARIRATRRTFDIVVSPIISPRGERLGSMLIWEDMTAILAADQELSELATAAAEGDFSKRIPLEDKQGFAKDMSSGLNALSSRVESAVQEFAAVLAAVADGDLTTKVEQDYRGGLGRLSEGINRTVERLAAMVAEIQRLSTEVADASREISSGAENLSHRTETQAHALEQTASTVEELAASVKASADSSAHAAGIAQQARAVAQEGGAIVSQAVEAMERIDQTSRKISEITTVIDDIAFQTNLLALNAAVEAARAGEAGKGFAVVASEVRTLAQRSSEAAKDITNLIVASNAEVTNGVRLVRAAGDTLGRIVDASNTVAASVSEISAASREQATGIQEITRAVAQLDETTQQNASLAEESAASSEQLSEQMQQLRSLADAFRTQAGVSRAPAGRAPATGASSPPSRGATWRGKVA